MPSSAGACLLLLVAAIPHCADTAALHASAAHFQPFPETVVGSDMLSARFHVGDLFPDSIARPQTGVKRKTGPVTGGETLATLRPLESPFFKPLLGPPGEMPSALNRQMPEVPFLDLGVSSGMP